MIKKQRITSIVAGLGLYLLTTGASAWAFGAFESRSATISPFAGNTQGGTALVIDASEPKDQACPINGKMYTKTEKNAWDQVRPILAMIENSTEARPQSGLSSADVVYEAVAEGGITRFMAVFYCGAMANPGTIAPMRSARIYFVNIAAEYNQPVYMHVGGGNCSRDQASEQCTSDKRAFALEELGKLGWRVAKGNDFDTTFDSGVPVFKRDENRLGPNKVLAIEHTMIASLTAAWQQATTRGFTGEMQDGSKWTKKFVEWKFKDGASEDQRGGTGSISFDFWEGYKDYSVRWEYDKSNNIYKRFTGDQPHIDLENNQQLSASNVVIQFAKEEGPIDIQKHMLYQVIGKGKGLVFQNGQVIEIAWEKQSQTARTIFTEAKSGKEIQFARGVVWVEVVPANNEISY